MNCPHCNTHIDEHPANRCLDAWVATDAMGAPSHPEYHEYYSNYSTSISAAWEVVEKFWLVEICSYPNGNIHVEFRHNERGSWRRGEAKTFPLAICRAAIKAMTNEPTRS